MIIRDLMLFVARGLNLSEVVLEILNNENVRSEEYNRLISCISNTISEITEEYYPLKTTQKIKARDGVILFEDFENVPVKIFTVRDEYDYNLKFVRRFNGIKVDRQEAYINYSYLVQNLKINDTIPLDCFSLRLLSYGVISEYFMMANRYEEAAMYSKRFKGSMKNLLSPTQELIMKKRSLL